MSVVKPAIQYPILIAYLEGANNYTWLHFRDGEKQLLAKPISYLELQPELVDFVRIHKTILVNPICVEQLVEPPRPKMAAAVQLEGGLTLPVSRRRWVRVATLLQTKLPPPVSLRSRVITVHRAPAPVPVALPDPPPRSVMAVTSSASSALLLTEIASQQWPHCTLHIVPEAKLLPDLLQRLAKTELPVLLLLDARTARQEQLNALQRIKQTDELCWIPIVLFLASTDNAVRDGYLRQANSVITIGRDHAQFVRALRRVGQFWLETAALPGAVRARL